MSTKKSNVEAPVKTSEKKRPNKAFIQRMAEFRGHMTGNERTQLATLSVKNAMQRVNNKAMIDDVTQNLTTKQNAELQKLIKAFVNSVDEVLKQK
jgi:ribosome recycling factor